MLRQAARVRHVLSFVVSGCRSLCRSGWFGVIRLVCLVGCVGWCHSVWAFLRVSGGGLGCGCVSGVSGAVA